MNKTIYPNIVRGGIAIPLDRRNYYYILGRSHEDKVNPITKEIEKGKGVHIGNNPKTGLEVEDGEIVKTGRDGVKVYSAVPMLAGKSPAERVLMGEDPNKVFAAQETFKKVNGLKDDGTKARLGKRKYIGSNEKTAAKQNADVRRQYWNYDTKLLQAVSDISSQYGIDPRIVISRMSREGIIDEGIAINNRIIKGQQGDAEQIKDKSLLDIPGLGDLFTLWGLDTIFDRIKQGYTKTNRPIPLERHHTQNEIEMVNSGTVANTYDALELLIAELASRQKEVKNKYPNLTSDELNSATLAKYNATTSYFNKLMKDGTYKTKFALNDDVNGIIIPKPKKYKNKEINTNYTHDTLPSYDYLNIIFNDPYDSDHKKYFIEPTKTLSKSREDAHKEMINNARILMFNDEHTHPYGTNYNYYNPYLDENREEIKRLGGEEKDKNIETLSKEYNDLLAKYNTYIKAYDKAFEESKNNNYIIDKDKLPLEISYDQIDSIGRILAKKTLDKYKGTNRDPLLYTNWAEDEEASRNYLIRNNIRENKQVKDYFASYVNSKGYDRIINNQNNYWKKIHPIRKNFTPIKILKTAAKDLKNDVNKHGDSKVVFEMTGYPNTSFALPGRGMAFVDKNITGNPSGATTLPYYSVNDEALGHEYAHLFDKYPAEGDPQREVLNINTNTNITKDKTANKHDSDISEKHADIWGLKYLLYKEGIYDSRSEDDITIEQIKKLREKYPKLRPLLQMDDKTLQFMLNNVADNKTTNRHKLVEVNIGGNSKLIRVPSRSFTGESERSEGRRKALYGSPTKKYFEDGTVRVTQEPIITNPLALDYTQKDIINLIRPTITSAEPISANTMKINPINERIPKNTNKSGIWGDIIGAGSNIIGSLITRGINNKMINNLKAPTMPVLETARKLKTKININPQLDKIRENLAEYERSVTGNTASSRIALARMNRGRNLATNQSVNLYGQKENTETQLINQDTMNQQGVDARNIERINRHLTDVTAFNNKVTEMKADNNVSTVQNINQGVQDLLARRDRRTSFNKTLMAQTFANPNLPAELFYAAGIWDKNTYDMYRKQYAKS